MNLYKCTFEIYKEEGDDDGDVETTVAYVGAPSLAECESVIEKNIYDKLINVQLVSESLLLPEQQ